MLKANVGLSRKVSKDYQSTGYTINLEGEITAPASDAEAVVEQIKELYDLAEEALDVQIERSQSVAAQASHDREPTATTTSSNRSTTNGSANGSGHTNSEDDPPATEKQITFLLTIGKRQHLSTAKLETRIAEVLGREVGLYDLTKRQAAIVLDALTGNGRTAKTSSRG